MKYRTLFKMTELKKDSLRNDFAAVLLYACVRVFLFYMITPRVAKCIHSISIEPSFFLLRSCLALSKNEEFANSFVLFFLQIFRYILCVHNVHALNTCH